MGPEGKLYKRDELMEKRTNGAMIPKPVPEGGGLIHWDATFNMNGGTKISDRKKPIRGADHVPFYLDCRRKTKLKL